MKLTRKDIIDMEHDVIKDCLVDKRRFDIKRKSEAWGTANADGVPTVSWAVIDTRYIELQPLRWYKTEQIEIELAGERYVPTFRGFLEADIDITGGDHITDDSGSTNILVLRAHDFGSHKELDLRQVH